MKHKLILCLFLLLAVGAWGKQKITNEQQARQIFDKAYNQVFGPQGATLHYDVDIIGIYKTHGTIWYKGKKQRFSDERVDTWNDGVTAFMAYRKRRVVEVHDAMSDKKDKYSGKFKFSLDDFSYRVEKHGNNLLLTLKQKKGAKGTIKEVKATVTQGTYHPISLKIKVAFIWAKIKISNFKSGGIDDNMFIFPREKYKGWEFDDKR